MFIIYSTRETELFLGSFSAGKVYEYEQIKIKTSKN